MTWILIMVIVWESSIRLVFFDWRFADHCQIAKRAVLRYGLRGQECPAVRRLSVQHGLVSVFLGHIALEPFRILFRVLTADVGRLDRQEVSQTTERCRWWILVERRTEIAILYSQHQLIHEVIAKFQFGVGFIARQ